MEKARIPTSLFDDSDTRRHFVGPKFEHPFVVRHLDGHQAVVQVQMDFRIRLESVCFHSPEDLAVVNRFVAVREDGAHLQAVETAEKRVPLALFQLQPVVEVMRLQFVGAAFQVGVGHPELVREQPLRRRQDFVRPARDADRRSSQ